MSDLDDTALRQYKAWFKADREHSEKWREQATEDFAFLAGEQWTEEEKRILKSQLRPVITFNRTHPIINSISGMEISNRQEVKYFPREPGDAKANELLTEGAKWFRDQANADDEDSDAFLDAAVCGMGWTETTLDTEEEDEPSPAMEAVNPLEMYWDKGARQKNLADTTRLWRVREIPRARAKEMFPSEDVTDLDARWAKADATDSDESQDEADRYEDNGLGPNVSADQEYVTLVHLQHKKKEPFYLVALMLPGGGGSQQEVDKKDIGTLRKRAAAMGVDLVEAQRARMTVKNIFIGGKVLQAGDALSKKHFSFQCITAYREHKTGLFYGLMRLMKDPQRWANKWMSQALHILNANAKGGLLAEKDAVEDVRQFEADWARPDKITWTKPGAVANGKIKEKTQAGFPVGFFQMMEFAIQSVRDVTGISVELLGMREANQAASLEYQRKQAGMTIVAPLFDNLKRYRREHGKLMLWIIQHYLADGRLVRIVGKEGAQYVPLAMQADIKYDIVVDDQPNSPDQKMMVWQSLLPIMPTLPPQVQLALVDYAPLPTSVIEKIKEAAGQMQQQPNPEQVKAEIDAQRMKMQMQSDAQKGAIEMQKTRTEAIVSQRESEAKLAEIDAQSRADAHKAATDAALGQIDIEKAEIALQLAAVQLANAKRAGASTSRGR